MLVLASTYPRWSGDPEPGFVHALSSRLTAHFEVIVLCPHSPGSKREEVMDGVRVVRYRYAPLAWQSLVNDGGMLGNLKKSAWKWLLVPGFLVGQVVSAARLMRSFRPDVVHAHWLVPQGVAARLAMFAVRERPRFVVTSHGADLFSLRSWPFRALKRWVLRGADLATVVSQAMVPVIRTLDPSAPVAVEPMGVDLVSTFRPEAGVQRSTNTALFVGRLVEKKGVAHLLEAWPRVLARNPQARLDIVGFGVLESELRRRSAELDLQASVTFLGAKKQSQLPDLYRRAATLVAPFVAAGDGDQEGLGLVMVEALGCGCPVVAGDVPAVRDVLGDGQAGSVVDPRDAVALSEAIIASMAGDPADPASVAGFDWEMRAQAYAGHLEAASRQVERPRQGHAALNVEIRRRKGQKIARLLEASEHSPPWRMLEVGTGSGAIAHFFGTGGPLGWDVEAVDVRDSRVCTDGFRFQEVGGVDLPFADEDFDAVVSNHVIEHVGGPAAQDRHLAEIHRVLRPGGVCYLAVPNRWMFREPHFKLPLLSWLPGRLADRYVRLAKRGSHYDCLPFSVGRLEPALRRAGFRFEQIHARALEMTFEIERPQATGTLWVIRHVPDWAYRFTRRLFPTLIYLLRKPDGDEGGAR